MLGQTKNGSPDEQITGSCKRFQRGLTLVEVIVGSTIFVIVAATAFAAIIQSFKLNKSSVDYGTANEVMRNEIEHLRGLNWTEVQALPSDSVFTTTFDNSFITRRQVSTRKQDQEMAKLEVSWTDSQSQTRSINTIILLSRGGI